MFLPGRAGGRCVCVCKVPAPAHCLNCGGGGKVPSSPNQAWEKGGKRCPVVVGPAQFHLPVSQRHRPTMLTQSIPGMSACHAQTPNPLSSLREGGRVGIGGVGGFLRLYARAARRSGKRLFQCAKRKNVAKQRRFRHAFCCFGGGSSASLPAAPRSAQKAPAVAVFMPPPEGVLESCFGRKVVGRKAGGEVFLLLHTLYSFMRVEVEVSVFVTLSLFSMRSACA